MQHDHVLKSWIRPFDPQGKGRWSKYLLPRYCIPIAFNLICNMTMFYKRWILTFLPLGSGGGGVSGHNTCYHVAEPAFPFYLMCNMTMFWKSWILTFWPHPVSPPRGSGTGLLSKITFDMFLIYCNSVCMRNFSKKYWQLTELLEVYKFDLWSHWGVVTF